MRENQKGPIYSDDPDAVQALQAKLDDLLAQRNRIKAYNKSCRAGARDVNLLDANQQALLISVATYTSYNLGKNGEMPGYVSANLSGNVASVKQRIAKLSAVAA